MSSTFPALSANWLHRRRTTSLGVVAAAAALAGLAACGSSPAAAPAPAGPSSSMTSAGVTISSAGAMPGAAASSAGPGATGGTAATTPAAGSAQREVNPAGDIPDSQAFVAYKPAGGGFSVSVPEGWARTDTPGGALFSDKYNSIQVLRRPAAAAPTESSLRATDLPALSRTSANFVLGKISTVTRKAGPAILVTYHADTPPNAVTGKVTTAAYERYAFYKSGIEVVITVGAPVGGDNVDPWRTVTDSLRWSA